jgi:hypothetical protein
MAGRDRTPAVTKHLVDLLFPRRTFVVLAARAADNGWVLSTASVTRTGELLRRREVQRRSAQRGASDEVYSALGVIRG